MINDKGADYLIERLEKAGYEAYYVGGCIRNKLMGIPVQDYDICTSALPHVTCEIFSDLRYFVNGIKHGTVSIVFEEAVYEITTFRQEYGYSDFRHPDKVDFSTDIHRDLLRRDFTINAMAYNKKSGLIDDFNGFFDVQNRILRTVNDPNERFNEDALRIIRGMRLASVYNLSVEENTAVAMIANAHLLDKVSKERIYSEFNKLMMGQSVDKILTQFKEVLSYLFPELKMVNNLEKYFNVINNLPNIYLRYATLFLSCRDKVSDVFFRLKSDKKTVKILNLLYSQFDFDHFTDVREVKRLMNALEDYIFDFIEWKIAIFKEFDKDERADKLRKTKKICQEVLKTGQCYNLKGLAINGYDLKNYAYSGAKIKQLLEIVLNAVIDEKVPNEKNKIIEYIKIYG